MWETMGELLPSGYRRLPAVAGLHLTVRADHSTRTEVPETRRALRRQGLLFSPLEPSYQFSEPAVGYLLGFAGVPTPHVVPAVRAFTTVLSEAGPPTESV